MQKTVLFGKNINQQNFQKSSNSSHCPNCNKLLTQLSDLNQILVERQSNIQDIISGSQSGPIKMLHEDLIDLKQKYINLKKKLKQLEKENEDLFVENTTLGKQLSACRIQIRQFQNSRKNGEEYTTLKTESGSNRQNSREQNDNYLKKLQIDVFVWKGKAEKLQLMLKSQGQQIVRLKELLRKRNRLQEQRHALLQILV